MQQVQGVNTSELNSGPEPLKGEAVGFMLRRDLALQ